MTNTPRTEEVVRVRGLRKTYAGRAVVDDLDLDVDAGEVVGLIGANGAGKTTTVECLQGLCRPDSGTISVLGCDPARDVGRLRTMVGSQLQDSGLPDRLRVGEALALFATGRARDGDDLLAQFGLTERRRSAFASLSGGERQRLFLVLALLNRPRLVILDELTQGLDPAVRRDVWAAVAQLRDAGTTVLLVTHELDEAEALCSRVVAMRAGRVLDQGTPMELMARHAPSTTISFGATLLDLGSLVAALRGLPGVVEVGVAAGRVVVRGDRVSIAYVGAELVRRGEVPADLDLQLPDLTAALLNLLEPPAAAATTGAASPASSTTLTQTGAVR